MPSPHRGPRARSPLLAALILACLVLAACSEESAAPTSRPRVTIPPAATPELSLEALARSAANDRLRRLLAGETVIGGTNVLDWSAVERQALPLGVTKDALCTALDAPHADDLVTELIAAGLSAISRRRGGQAVSAATAAVRAIVVSLSFETCPAWKPVLLPLPTVAPPPVSPMPGFTALMFDPSTAWRLLPEGAAACPTSWRGCWQTPLFAGDGCLTGAEMSISVVDASGVPLRLASASVGPLAAGEIADFLFEAGDLSHGARVYAVTCS
jgi:hypothetical protein